MRKPSIPSLTVLARERERGLADGLSGSMRAHGGYAYHEGYDDGLDLWDAEHAEEL